MHKTYEIELPEDYSAIMTVDAKDKKTASIFTVSSLILTVAGIILCLSIYHPTLDEIFTWKYYIAIIILMLYLVLHELTHGAAYKILTGRKLTFGITLSFAYCGVPDIFVYRKTALISLLAPFTVFNIVFLLGACLLPTSIDRFFSAAILAFHIAGCSGDLYDAWLLMTKLRSPSLLMKDTGPKQTFYMKKSQLNK